MQLIHMYKTGMM